MTIETALAVLALLATPAQPEGHRVAALAAAAPDAALAEMAPVRGHWEVEDAPAYFSDRLAFRDEVGADRVSLRAMVPDRRP